MKVLLCNPDTNLTVSNQAGSLSNTVAICAPLGIGYLAGMLRERGHDAAICDFFDSSEEQIAATLKDQAPDVVGISCFTEHRGAALKLARLAKKINSSVHVVMGGSHASFYAETMLNQYPEIDSIVMHEGENSLSEWVQWLGSGRNVSTVSAGAAFRGPDGVVKVGGRAPPILNLDSIPFPVRDPVNMPPYKAYPPRYTLGRQATMMATRGCPYRCQFCSTTRYWGSRYRTRSVENVLQELELLTLDRKVEYVHFFDDALTARKQWILELCNEIARRRLRFDWEAITRVNYVDEDICRAMRKAGCKSVIFGVESFSDKILNTIHKGVTGGQAIEALKTAGKTGLKTTCLLMVGNPGESWETIKETACGIRSARPTHMDVCLTAVFPKTELYEIATRAGLLDDTYWLNESLSAPIFTVEHSIDTLQKFRDVLYDAYWSCRWFVSLYRKSGLRKLRHRLAKRQEYPGKGQVDPMKQSEGLCQPAAENAEGRKRPLVWFMAQGYAIRGGNEAHILHYATELRNHGFDTKAVVPNALPKHEHLFMRLLHERGIPLESVGDSVAARTLIAFCVLVLPWTLRQALKRRKFSFNDFRNFLSHRMTAHALRKKIAAEAPDIIHIFGRLADNLWSVIPPERTVFHHATEGRVDKSWEASEIENFRRFAESAARNFAPGSGVAGNVRREFGIHRTIDTIFTMCPDEAGSRLRPGLPASPYGLRRTSRRATGGKRDELRTTNDELRFGILCRFTDEKGISCILEALKQYREKHGDVDFTLRRQDSPWLATGSIQPSRQGSYGGQDGNGGYGGFRSDTPRLRAWSFTFAGQGELEGMIRGFIESNRLSNVRLARVSTASEILKDIDVFVHPSVTDAMPMAIVEALMCWCPCISTRVGGIPDLVRDGIEGFLIEPKRSDQILERMERFAAMPEEEFAGFRKRARARYEERCTPSKVGAIVAAHYRDILGVSHRAHRVHGDEKTRAVSGAKGP